MNAIAKLKEKIGVIDKLLSVTANSTRRHAELKELSRSKNQNELNEIYNELKRLSIRNITESE